MDRNMDSDHARLLLRFITSASVGFVNMVEEKSLSKYLMKIGRFSSYTSMR